jgi:hypothetical protein
MPDAYLPIIVARRPLADSISLYFGDDRRFHRQPSLASLHADALIIVYI